jgi:cytochrome c551/c552
VQGKWLTAAVLALELAATDDATAQSGVAGLIDQQHCMYCHTTEGANLAPSFPQIAQRYRTVPGPSVMLAKKVRNDGKAHWDEITMPDADRVAPLSPEQADMVVQWVLSQ